MCRVTLACCALTLCAAISATAKLPAQEGSRLYTPTREEWIAVLFNSMYPMDEMAAHGFRIKYICPPGTETVFVHATYRKDVDRAEMNQSIEMARKMILAYAESKGWESWVKVDEKLVLSKDPPTVASRDQPFPAGVEKDELKELLREALRDALKESTTESPSKE